MPSLPPIPARLSAHPKWCALFLGVLAACGFEPLGLWPLTLIAVAGLIELIARAPSGRQAALLGWLFGLGHFTLGDNWIATAFTYQAQMPAWLGWIAVAGLSLYLAVYPALAALLAWRLGRSNYAALIFAFASSWIVTEWLRSWVFTGFVWNPLAMALLGPFERPGLAAMQSVWLGTYGLSGLLCLMAGAWLLAVKRGKADWRGAAMLLLPAVLVLLPGPRDRRESALRYTLIQPNIPEERLNDPANFETQFAINAALSSPEKPGETRLVLWPESGVQDYLREGYPPRAYAFYTYGGDPALARARLARAIGPGSLLLTGTMDAEYRAGKWVGARNAVTAIHGNGMLRGGYYKAHLVPYGEYLPMRRLLEPLGLSRLVPGDMDFWPGPGPRTLNLGEFGKVGVQICYEIIFSGQVIDRAHRPDYIFNPSNDGWFGAWGPPQFLAQARLRAIEEGLPVLRSTTTGISAVIDANGAVRRSIPRGKAARLDGMMPAAHPPTLFARLGNIVPLGWAVVLLGLCLVATRRRRG